ncbi:MAG: Ig-like domain-containing protein [Gemmatimonadota bacterium]|nr:Ig-like domain-containing protein [Gemmatimonadota bacterium]
MARAARNARRQAARLGLLTAWALAACAVMQDPPGGPPDFAPPTIVAITPDSGSVAPQFDGRLRFQFDEVINEQSGGGLAKLIELSPRATELDVSWKRTAIEVKPASGWRANAVYRVVLLPGVADLRNNRMEAGRTVVFSTGGEIPATRLTGVVLDWENGRVGQRAIVEAVLLPDSLVYTARSDSVGEFVLSEIPVGSYWIVVAMDGNTNGRREPREPFDSISVQLDSIASHEFWAFARDTVGPVLREVTAMDSLTVRLEFAQKLSPGRPDTAAVRVFALPDTVPVAVSALYDQTMYDSLAAAEARERAQRDSIAAAAADTVPAVPAPEPPQARGRAAGAQQAAPDSSRAALLLAERPVLKAAWFVQLSEILAPGGRYLVEATATNVSGATADSRSVLVIPAPRDST